MSGIDPRPFLDFQIDPSDLEKRRTLELSRKALEPGQVRFRVDRFAFTANNISYASTGSFLGYLNFFPTDIEAPWRRIPVMGHGEIIESSHPDIESGGRYFGFYPMSGEHVITAERRGANVWDAGSHREPHAATYRQFEDVRRDPHYDPAREDLVALLRGLYVTSFLVEDYLHDNAGFGAESVLVTSASSKTSIALGYCLRQRGTPSIGLTSHRNLDAVRKLNCFDNVLPYDELPAIDHTRPTALVDLAGDGALLAAIHHQFGDALKYSCVVGGTHRGAAAAPTELPGPTPRFFFAPSQIKKRSGEWGAVEFTARLGQGFRDFGSFIEPALHIVRGSDAEAVDRAYGEVLDGRSSPTTGHILSLSGN